MVLRADEPLARQEGHGIRACPLVDALAPRQYVNVVEHFEKRRAGLVNRAYNRPSADCEGFQHRQALHRRQTVQTAGNNRWVIN